MKKEKISSYLKQLKFDPELLNTFRAKYLTNIRIVILLVTIIVVAGVSSFLNLSRRLNPEVKIPIVLVSTVLPGASPDNVESLITTPLEDSINRVKGANKIDSVSSESVSTISIEFNSGTDPEKAKNDIQSAVDSVTNLPKDALKSQVLKLDFENQPVWTFALTSDSDPITLRRFAKILKDKLEEIPEIDKVDITGLDTEEIQILVKPEIASIYNINPLQLLQLIQGAKKSYPAGSVSNNSSSFSIGIDSSVTSIAELREQIITINGQNVKLSDIAEITERPAPNQTTAYYSSSSIAPKKVITFSVSKVTGSDIEKSSKKARTVAEATIRSYQNQFQIITVRDAAQDISRQFSDLIKNYRDTLILVFITFLIFLGIRQAIIAALTIPLTFLVTFTIMRMMGLTLNFLSLFSLLLSLGLLVDDTIVVVTGITSYYRTGKFTPTQAGLLVWKDFIVPIWTTTISTVWAFVPLLLATGIIGEFIKSIPIIVATTLYSSTAIAVLITLPLMMVILKPSIPRRVRVLFKIIGIIAILFLVSKLIPQNPLTPFIFIFSILLLLILFRLRQNITIHARGFLKTKIKFSTDRTRDVVDSGLINLEHFGRNTYKKLILKVLESKSAKIKLLIAVGIFSIFSYILVPLGFVVNEFFPKSGSDLFNISVELPAGTALPKTDQEAKRLANELRTTTGIEYITTQTGQGADVSGQGGGAKGDNYILISMVLPEKSKRKINSNQIADNLRKKYTNYNIGTFSVIEESGGPPAGADIQIQLSGDDLTILNGYADRIVEYLNTQVGVVNASKSYKTGTGKLTFVPDLEKMSEAGVDISTTGLFLRTFNSGLKLDDVKVDGDSEDIVFRMNKSLQTPQSLGLLTIPSQNGSVPLLSLGKLELKANPTQITRSDGKRTITVSSGIKAGFSVTGTNQKLEKFADSLNLPPGYEWKTGGVNEENQKSVQSILMAMILAFILILATMVVQFQSYRKAFIVMLVIPLAISGVFVIFALTGTPLSFPSLIGVLALFGIVVNNAMMLVDKINLNKKVGLPFKEGIADAAASRFEPIFLGSLTTIVGLIPITIQDPLWRGLGGAIIAGLTFSGIIMLFFIPVVYSLMYKSEDTSKKTSSRTS